MKYLALARLRLKPIGCHTSRHPGKVELTGFEIYCFGRHVMG